MAALIWRPLEGSEVKNNMPSRKYVRCVAVVFQTRCHNSGITTAIIIPSICRITKLSHSHYPYQDGEHHMVVIVIVVAIISIATATTTASAKQRHSTNGVRSQVTTVIVGKYSRPAAEDDSTGSLADLVQLLIPLLWRCRLSRLSLNIGRLGLAVVTASS